MGNKVSSVQQPGAKRGVPLFLAKVASCSNSKRAARSTTPAAAAAAAGSNIHPSVQQAAAGSSSQSAPAGEQLKCPAVQSLLEAINLGIYTDAFLLAGFGSLTALDLTGLTPADLAHVEALSKVPILPHHQRGILAASQQLGIMLGVRAAEEPPPQPMQPATGGGSNLIVTEVCRHTQQPYTPAAAPPAAPSPAAAAVGGAAAVTASSCRQPSAVTRHDSQVSSSQCKQQQQQQEDAADTAHLLQDHHQQQQDQQQPPQQDQRQLLYSPWPLMMTRVVVAGSRADKQTAASASQADVTPLDQHLTRHEVGLQQHQQDTHVRKQQPAHSRALSTAPAADDDGACQPSAVPLSAVEERAVAEQQQQQQQLVPTSCTLLGLSEIEPADAEEWDPAAAMATGQHHAGPAAATSTSAAALAAGPQQTVAVAVDAKSYQRRAEPSYTGCWSLHTSTVSEVQAAPAAALPFVCLTTSTGCGGMRGSDSDAPNPFLQPERSYILKQQHQEEEEEEAGDAANPFLPEDPCALPVASVSHAAAERPGHQQHRQRPRPPAAASAAAEAEAAAEEANNVGDERRSGTLMAASADGAVATAAGVQQAAGGPLRLQQPSPVSRQSRVVVTEQQPVLSSPQVTAAAAARLSQARRSAVGQSGARTIAAGGWERLPGAVAGLSYAATASLTTNPLPSLMGTAAAAGQRRRKHATAAFEAGPGVLTLNAAHLPRKVMSESGFSMRSGSSSRAYPGLKAEENLATTTAALEQLAKQQACNEQMISRLLLLQGCHTAAETPAAAAAGLAEAPAHADTAAGADDDAWLQAAGSCLHAEQSTASSMLGPSASILLLQEQQQKQQPLQPVSLYAQYSSSNGGSLLAPVAVAGLGSRAQAVAAVQVPWQQAPSSVALQQPQQQPQQQQQQQQQPQLLVALPDGTLAAATPAVQLTSCGAAVPRSAYLAAAGSDATQDGMSLLSGVSGFGRGACMTTTSSRATLQTARRQPFGAAAMLQRSQQPQQPVSVAGLAGSNQHSPVFSTHSHSSMLGGASAPGIHSMHQQPLGQQSQTLRQSFQQQQQQSSASVTGSAAGAAMTRQLSGPKSCIELGGNAADVQSIVERAKAKAAAKRHLQQQQQLDGTPKTPLPESSRFLDGLAEGQKFKGAAAMLLCKPRLALYRIAEATPSVSTEEQRPQEPPGLPPQTHCSSIDTAPGAAAVAPSAAAAAEPADSGSTVGQEKAREAAAAAPGGSLVAAVRDGDKVLRMLQDYKELSLLDKAVKSRILQLLHTAAAAPGSMPHAGSEHASTGHAAAAVAAPAATGSLEVLSEPQEHVQPQQGMAAACSLLNEQAATGSSRTCGGVPRPAAADIDAPAHGFSRSTADQSPLKSQQTLHQKLGSQHTASPGKAQTSRSLQQGACVSKRGAARQLWELTRAAGVE